MGAVYVCCASMLADERVLCDGTNSCGTSFWGNAVTVGVLQAGCQVQ